MACGRLAWRTFTPATENERLRTEVCMQPRTAGPETSNQDGVSSGVEPTAYAKCGYRHQRSALDVMAGQSLPTVTARAQAA